MKNIYKKNILVILLLALMSSALFAKEPHRPKTVPKQAVWVEDDSEWELGKRNSNGEMVGEWKWWLAPKGHLVCHTFFDNSGTDTMTYKRYHADGTVSRKGRWINGQPDGVTVSIKSKHATTEHFNPRVDCWKAVTTFKDGYVIEEHYYDKKGKETHKPYIAK